jgi:hypothetical protein
LPGDSACVTKQGGQLIERVLAEQLGGVDERRIPETASASTLRLFER